MDNGEKTHDKYTERVRVRVVRVASRKSFIDEGWNPKKLKERTHLNVVLYVCA